LNRELTVSTAILRERALFDHSPEKPESANSRRVKRIYGCRYGRVFSAQDLIGLDQGNALTRSRTISPWLVLKNFRLIVVVDRNVVNKLNIA